MTARGTSTPGSVSIASAGMIDASASFFKRQHIEPSQILHMDPILFLSACTNHPAYLIRSLWNAHRSYAAMAEPLIECAVAVAMTRIISYMCSRTSTKAASTKQKTKHAGARQELRSSCVCLFQTLKTRLHQDFTQQLTRIKLSESLLVLKTRIYELGLARCSGDIKYRPAHLAGCRRPCPCRVQPAGAGG